MSNRKQGFVTGWHEFLDQLFSPSRVLLLPLLSRIFNHLEIPFYPSFSDYRILPLSFYLLNFPLEFTRLPSAATALIEFIRTGGINPSNLPVFLHIFLNFQPFSGWFSLWESGDQNILLFFAFWPFQQPKAGGLSPLRPLFVLFSFSYLTSAGAFPLYFMYSQLSSKQPTQSIYAFSGTRRAGREDNRRCRPRDREVIRRCHNLVPSTSSSINIYYQISSFPPLFYSVIPR